MTLVSKVCAYPCETRNPTIAIGRMAYPKHLWVRDSRGRKIEYVLWGRGVAIAWRDWYVKGTDSAAEQQVMALALAKAA